MSSYRRSAIRPAARTRRHRSPILERSRRILAGGILAGSILALLATPSAKGANFFWDADGTPLGNNPISGGNLGGTGVWDATTPLWYDAATGTLVAWPNSLLDTATFFGGTAPTVTIDAGGINAGALRFLTTGYTLTGGTITLGLADSNVFVATGVTATISSVIAGTNGLSLVGPGMLVLNGATSNSYTGTTSLSNGATLNLNFANNATNIINGASPLTFNSGTLALTGLAGATDSQTFASTSVAGRSIITLTQNAATSLTLNLGTITQTGGGTVNFSVIPLTTGVVATTSSVNVNGILGRWASVGLLTGTLRYATVNGSNQIVAYTGGTAAATPAALVDVTGTVNYDLASASGTAPASFLGNTIRMTGGANTTTVGATAFSVNGLMNAGTGTWTIGTNDITIGGEKELVVTLNASGMNVTGVILNNAGGASGLTLTSTSTGTLTLSRVNTYTGPTTVNGGTLAVGIANAIDSASTVTVNGGTFSVGTFGNSVAAVTLKNGIITGTTATGVLTSASAFDFQSGTATASLAGTAGLVKTTGGFLTMNSATANSFTGGVIIKAGTILTNNGNVSSLGTNAITLGDTSGSADARLQLGGTIGTYSNVITLATGTTGVLSIGSQNTSTALFLTGGVTGANNLVLGNSGAATLTFTTAAINNAGTLTHMGSSTGGGFINGGVGANVGNITQGSNTATFTIGTTPWTMGGDRSLNSTGTFLFTVSGGITGTGNLALRTRTTGGITLSTAQVNPAGTITNSGTGSGTATISGGIGTNVGNITQASDTSPLTISTTPWTLGGNRTLTSTGTALATLSGGVSGAFDLTFKADSTGAITASTLSVNNGGTITNSGTGSGLTTISAVIGTNVTGVVQNSANSALTLSGANTFTGAGLTVKRGVANLGVSNATTVSGAAGPSASAITLGDTGGGSAGVFISGAFTVSNPINVIAGAPGTLSLGNSSAASAAVFSSAITLNGYALTLATNGSGLLTFNATSSFTGPGSITGGSTGSGQTTINSVLGSAITSVTQAATTAGSTILLNNIANQFGSLSIKSGTVRGDNAGLGTFFGAGTITLGDAFGGSTVGATLMGGGSGTHVTSNAIVLGASVGQPLTIASNNITSFVTFSGGVTGPNDLVLSAGTQSTTSNLIFSGLTNNAGTVSTSSTAPGTGPILLSGGIGSLVTGVNQNSANSRLELSGTNSYSGPTNINAGTLTLAGGGSLASTAVTAAGGTTFSVTGDWTIGTTGSGSVGMAGGSILSLVGGGVNTLTINTTTPAATALTLAGGAGSALNFDLGATADQIVLGSGLLANVGASGTVTVNITSIGALSGTTQTLISAPGGGLNANPGAFTLNATTGNFGGYTLALVNTSGTVLQLTETGTPQATLYFKGNQSPGGANWNTFLNGNDNDSNWTIDAAGTTDGRSNPNAGTDVHFYAANATLASLTSTLGQNYTIKTLTFDGGALNNAVSIAPGGGTLTITPADPATGIAVNGGAGIVTISAPIVLGANQTWTDDSANAVTTSGGVTGTGNLTIKNNGTATFALGTVATNNVGAITSSGTGAGFVNLSGIGANVTGFTLATTNAAAATTISNTNGIVVNTGGTTFTSTSPALLTLSGVVTGTGNLTYNVNSSGGIVQSGAVNSTGTITVSGSGSGLTTLSGATASTVGNITFMGSGTTTATLGTAAINASGIITNSGTTTGTTSITGAIGANVAGVVQNSPTSLLTLTASNPNFNSGLTIRAGTVSATGTATATGFGAATNIITLGDSAPNAEPVRLVGNTAAVASAALSTYANPIVLASGTTGTLTIAAPGVNNVTTFTGGVTGTKDLVLNPTGTSGAGGLIFSTGSINHTGTLTNTGTNRTTINSSIGSNVTTIAQGTGSAIFTINSALALTSTNRILESFGSGLFELKGGFTGAQNIVFNANSSGGITVSTVNADHAGTITNSGTGAGTLTVSSGVDSNVTGLILNSTTSAMTVSGPISVNGAGTTLTNTAGTRLLTVSGGIGGTGNLVIQNNSTTINGVTFSTGAINNTGSFTNSGSGSGTETVGVVIGSSVTSVNQSGVSGLTLTATNLYTGATNITAGVLTLSGTGAGNSSSGFSINGSTAKLLQTSSVAISPIVTLVEGIVDGTTTINFLNVGSAGAGSTKVVTAGNGGAGTLAFGTLTLNGSANINLTQAGAVFNSRLATTTLHALGAAGAVTFNLSNSSLYSAGNYDLITYSSFASGSLAQFSLAAIPGLTARQSAALFDSGTAIQLQISGAAASLVWTGAQSAEWSTASIAGSKNWLNGAAPDDFVTGDNVTFDDSGATTVSIAGADVAPTSTTFNHSVNYALGGSFVISAGTLTKSGTGTLTINNANTYSGATTIQNGTIIISITNALPTGTNLILGNNVAGAGATHGTLDLTNFSQTVGGLTVLGDSTTVSAADTILIGAGKTLTVNGNVAIGQPTGSTVPKFTASGGGALVVNGTTFQIGTNTVALPSGSSATVDLTGLSSVTITLTGSLNIGDNSSSNAGKASSLFLPTTGAGNTTITAAAMTVGTQGRNNAPGFVNSLVLGSGANGFNVNNFNVGAVSGTARDAGSVTFANAAGTFKLRNITGLDVTGRAAMTVTGGAASSNTGILRDSTFDVSGHNADLLISTLTIGDMVGVGLSTNTFSFDTGILDATTINIARRASTAASANAHTYTVNFGSNPSSTGVVNVGTGGITLLNQATTTGTTNPLVSTLNILGGTVTLGGDIRQLVTGTASHTGTLNLDGGTLDMGGFRIGGAAAANNIDVLIFASGTLRNVATINNGANLIKTTGGTLTLAGVNGYLGATQINAGTVNIDSLAAGAASQSLGRNTGANAVTLGVASTSSGTLNYTGPAGTLDKNITSLGNGTDTVRNSGTGLLTLSGTLTKDGTTLTLNGGANGIAVTGQIVGASANSDLTVTGDSTTTLSNANSYAGATTVGTVAPSATTLAVTGSLSGTTAVTVNSGGTVLLNNSTAPAITSTPTVTLNGGTLALNSVVNTQSQDFGTLTLSANSFLDFASSGTGGNTFFFSGWGAHTSGSTALTINNWNGTLNTLGMIGVDDRLIFNGNASAFMIDFGPADISFSGHAAGYAAISFNGGTQFEIVPVPEPATTTLIGAVALCALIGYRERRRVSGLRRRKSSASV